MKWVCCRNKRRAFNGIFHSPLPGELPSPPLHHCDPRPHALTKNMSIKTNKLTLNEKIKCLSLQFVVCPQPFGSPRHETKERPNPLLCPPSFVKPLPRIVNQATTLLLRLCNWQNSFRPQSSAPTVCETVPQTLSHRCRLSMHILRLGSSYAYVCLQRRVNNR